MGVKYPVSFCRGMRRALLLVLLLVTAGCASPPPQGDQGEGAYAFVTQRVDLSGDGLYDHVNVTLVTAPGNLSASKLTFQVDGEALETSQVLSTPDWTPGQSVLLPCEEGSHEFRVLLDGETKKVIVHVCGVQAPAQPPLFEARLVDGDGDGRMDAIQLRPLSGDPVDPRELEAVMGGEQLRLYETPLKSRVARAPVGEGGRLFTPCVPQAQVLNLTWRDQPLPGLTVSGCQDHIPGVDAPIFAEALDVDGDERQDGWNLTLGAPNDGPFPLEELNATWDGQPAQVNGSVGLAAAPTLWAGGDDLVLLCPDGGTHVLELRINGTLVFQVAGTSCEPPPGQPLLELELAQGERGLAATLELSRLGPVNASLLSQPGNGTVGNGTWEPGSTRTLACPGGTLVLHYEGRLAFRGAAPC